MHLNENSTHIVPNLQIRKLSSLRVQVIFPKVTQLGSQNLNSGNMAPEPIFPMATSHRQYNFKGAGLDLALNK